MPEHAMWAGGRNVPVRELAPDYVRRNFSEIATHGIALDCAVWTCSPAMKATNARIPSTA